MRFEIHIKLERGKKKNGRNYDKSASRLEKKMRDVVRNATLVARSYGKGHDALKTLRKSLELKCLMIMCQCFKFKVYATK